MAADDLYGLTLIAIAAWAFLIFFTIGRTRGHRPTPRQWQRYRNPPGSYRNFPDARPWARPGLKDLRQPAGPDLADPVQQLRAVEATRFNRRPLLSRAEYRVFKVIEDDVAAARRGYRVFAQTTLGEILWSPNEDAFHAINSKRVDILIVDQGGWPVAAVEYQGAGHYQVRPPPVTPSRRKPCGRPASVISKSTRMIVPRKFGCASASVSGGKRWT